MNIVKWLKYWDGPYLDIDKGLKHWNGAYLRDELGKKWINIDIAGYWKYIKVSVPGGIPADGLKIYSFGACGGVEHSVSVWKCGKHKIYIDV